MILVHIVPETWYRNSVPLQVPNTKSDNIMGSAWSRWLESQEAFDKSRYVDADGQRVFYASLKLAANAIERAVVNEQADFTLNGGDEQSLAQLQYVLENWSREVGALYDRVGDFPLILPIPNELHAPVGGSDSLKIDKNSPPRSQNELLLKASSVNKFATSEEVYVALQRVGSKLPDDELLRIVAKYPRATRLFVGQHIQARMDVETPFRLLEASGQYTRAASLVGALAYGEESFVKKRLRLQEMSDLCKRAQHDPDAPVKDRATAYFNQAMTNDMLELIDTQNRLENQLGVMHLIGSSVIETVHKLLMLFPTHATALSSAARFAADFDVHPKQFWWSILKILPQNEQWHTLFMLSTAVPPPFGFTPIAEALVMAQRTDLGPELIATIVSPDERVAVMQYLAANEPANEQGEEGHDG